MINGKDVYDVLAAVVPLYVAMILAYGSVRWWRIFTPDQCSGINRFVAVFAVPLLSFHFISTNDIYNMDYRFLAADSLQKLLILSALAFWHNMTPTTYNLCCCSCKNNTNLDWAITLFSLSTLPNTLVMGIPLLSAMYGDFSGGLMVQIVVLQSVIWYTLMLFLFEYRAAKLLIADQLFPGGHHADIAGSITSFRVESDVVSLNGREPLQADVAEIGSDGKVHVVVRRSTTSLSSSINNSTITPRASNLAGVEIYSLQSTSREPTPRGSSFNLQSPNPNLCSNPNVNNDDDDQMGTNKFVKHRGAGSRSSDFMSNLYNQNSTPPSTYPTPNLQMVSALAASADSGGVEPSKVTFEGKGSASTGMIEIEDGSKSPIGAKFPVPAEKKVGEEVAMEVAGGVGGGGNQQMPPTSVMTRLILIMVWRKLIRNPNTYSSLIGFLWSLVSFRWHIEMPTIIKGSISILSDAGLGMAMFSLGLFMALQPKMIACGKSVAAFSMAVRFLTGPAVMAATSIAVGLRGVLLHVAIVQAALPQGIVPFVFAKEYNCHPDILSTAVIFGMLIALPITILYYILLGV